MKTTFLITATIAAITLFGPVSSAEARSRHKHSQSHVYVSGYRSCGTPLYKERYIIRYDRCGYPVWGHRVVHPPVRYCPPPRQYHRRPVVCPPPYPHYRDQCRSGVVISGNFRL
jgi:hypothetical protein